MDFEQPDVKKGDPISDFGQGFYLTEHLSRATDRAFQKVNESGGEPYVLVFDFDDAGAGKDLRILYFKEDEVWGKFLIDNRKGIYDGPDYDIAVGPSADAQIEDVVDCYYQDYLSDCIDWDEFIRELRLHVFGEQYCFKTQFATDRYLDKKGVWKYNGQIRIYS